jgi:ring-1,2-phenylacetyl-CoA epoxidase subunit PaaE
VLGPFGSFVVGPRTGLSPAGRRLVLVAGGSGITPLASIARMLLASEPTCELALVYANRGIADAIFASALAALAATHPGRLTVTHVLEQAHTGFEGEIGRLDRATVARVLDALPSAADGDTAFFLCGPDGMRDEVLHALATRGVADASIHVERFSVGPRPHAGPSSGRPTTSSKGARPLAIRVRGQTHSTLALPGMTVLEAGLAAGVDMPYSCAVGGCGACRVKLVAGAVELEEPNCLSEAERSLGYVLACVGRPSGPCTVEVPTNDGGL